jgi:rod shape-determining protein MreC
VREPDGLIGQVIETGANTSRVLLLIDRREHRAGAPHRDGMPAIASGAATGCSTSARPASRRCEFQPGDTFVTSGTGGVFPPNIPVARVIRPARHRGRRARGQSRRARFRAGPADLPARAGTEPRRPRPPSPSAKPRPRPNEARIHPAGPCREAPRAVWLAPLTVMLGSLVTLLPVVAVVRSCRRSG